MTIQTPVFVSTQPDDGKGDKLRDAFIKINERFQEVESSQAAGISEIYQGARPSDPTVRGDDSPLEDGDFYFNTTLATPAFKVYVDGAWVIAPDIIASSLAAVTGSTLVGFQQDGTGAVARTVDGKLRESVSVKDFGGAAETVENLRLVNGSAGQQIQLQGYYAPGDGGGGPLRVWQTGAPGAYVDNGGSIIVPTGGDGSGAWVWEWSGPVSPKWLGDMTHDVDRTRLIGGSIRRNTLVSPDWFIINDSAHIPINLNNVELSSANVRVGYDGDKIATLIAAPDETLAADGVAVGSSVGATFANISLGAPCSFIIDFDAANAITFSTRYFAAERFNVSIAPSGLITINHPILQLTQMPSVRHSAGSSFNENLTTHYLTLNGASQTRLFLLGEAEGLIRYVGAGAWGITSSDWTNDDITGTYDSGTGTLTVAHPTVIGSPGISVVPYVSNTEFVCLVSDVTSSGFKVRFRRFDGTNPPLTSAVGFYFSRGVTAIRKVPAGRLFVDVGHVKINAAHVDVPLGNIWVHGNMRAI